MSNDNDMMMVSDPRQKPEKAYPKVDGIDCSKFELPMKGLTDAERNEALSQLSLYVEKYKDNFMGYQVNPYFENFSEDFAQYLNIHLNNVGDPFVSGNLNLNTKFVERAVLDYFASLWNAKWPHEMKNKDMDTRTGPDWTDTYWGYVASMGSSEGNMYGLWNARD